LQGLWDLHRILPSQNPEKVEADELPRVFSAGKQRDGKVQEVRDVLTFLPGLCHCGRIRMMCFPRAKAGGLDSPTMARLKKVGLKNYK
jgi:hypothetical protein